MNEDKILQILNSVRNHEISVEEAMKEISEIIKKKITFDVKPGIIDDTMTVTLTDETGYKLEESFYNGWFYNFFLKRAKNDLLKRYRLLKG